MRQERQRTHVVLAAERAPRHEVVEQDVDQLVLDGEARPRRRLVDRRPQLAAGHRAHHDLGIGQCPRQNRKAGDGPIAVRAQAGDRRAPHGRRRRDQRGEGGDEALLLGRVATGLVQLLELVDNHDEPDGPRGRRADRAGPFLGIGTAAQASFDRRRVEALVLGDYADQARHGLLARRHRHHLQPEPFEHGAQPGLEQRRLARARRADHPEKPRLAGTVHHRLEAVRGLGDELVPAEEPLGVVTAVAVHARVGREPARPPAP
ncbi:MAG TPA: hypothetical protein VFI47_06830 [Acidimicrobiales bacterium]|nr:hypothetical protein [Acidimicrobiales bacterium]